ncbi:tRNA (N(6)-L-threonylcarbamoyladenosine(37)-C(2))-methylthiotransferase MtaB [Verrucomicrobiota bacterium]
MIKTVSFKTIGCRLNQAETAHIAGQFNAAGYRIVPFGKTCDICVIHTCAVTHKAEKDSARIARSVKRSNEDCFVILTGCAVETGGKKLLSESSADIVINQSNKFKLLELIAETPTLQHSNTPYSHTVILPHFSTTRALVKVQDGCDFRCAYCIVPFTRGSSKSRPFQEILDEVNKLVDTGFREVVLTGANLGCYEYNNKHLVDLIHRIESTHIDRIRLSSIELSTTERAIIEYMTQSEKLCRYIHLPLQSGDNNTLRLMKRKYTISEYRQLIDYAVEKIPFLGIGTDIIVGFPGENDTAFGNTLSMVRELPFSNLHVFPYSKRPGTRAETMKDQVSEKDKKQRTSDLINIGAEKKKSFAVKFLKKKVSVLIEKISNDCAAGWTSEYVKAKIRGSNIKPNRIIEFTPSKYDGETLQGTLS